MQDQRLKTSTIVAAFAVPIGFILLGAGCFQAVNKAGNDLSDAIVLPQKASVEALQKAKEVAAEQKAKENERNEMVSDDVNVAMVLTDGTTAPAGASVLADTFGCNDRIVLVKEHKAAATDSIVHDSLLTLFALKDSGTHTPLYNSLASSSLTIEKIQSTDGVNTEVWLKGTVESGGACDGPRIKEQIETQIKRFRPKYKIFLNGSEATYRCLGDMTGQCI